MIASRDADVDRLDPRAMGIVCAAALGISLAASIQVVAQPTPPEGHANLPGVRLAPIPVAGARRSSSFTQRLAAVAYGNTSCPRSPPVVIG